MNDQRNSWGFPQPEERGYLPREQARELQITMEDDEPVQDTTRAIVGAAVIAVAAVLAAFVIVNADLIVALIFY